MKTLKELFRGSIRKFTAGLSLVVLTATTSFAAGVEDMPTYILTAHNGRFDPEVVTVPTGKRFKLTITNKGPGPEEFESRDLRQESVLAPGVTRTLVFAPLKAGTYPFFGEFHPDTAQGRIVAK